MEETESDRARGLLQKGNLSPPSCPTTHGERQVQRWQAALRASMAVPLLLVRDLHSDLLLKAEIRRCCQLAGATEVGKQPRRTWRLKAQRDGLLAQGFSFNGFPGVDTSAGKSFTFARRKEGKVAPLFSGFKTASPPQNCEACGGTALLVLFFHESGGWVSLIFKHLPPAFLLLYSRILLPAGRKPAVKTKPLSGGLCEPPVPPPYCCGAQPCRAASTMATEFAGDGSSLAAVPRALPGAACLPQRPADTRGQSRVLSSACSALGAAKAAGISTRYSGEWSPCV